MILLFSEFIPKTPKPIRKLAWTLRDMKKKKILHFKAGKNLKVISKKKKQTSVQFRSPINKWKQSLNQKKQEKDIRFLSLKDKEVNLKRRNFSCHKTDP